MYDLDSYAELRRRHQPILMAQRMTIRSLFLLIMAISVLAIAPSVDAANKPLVYYWAPDGSVSEQSRDSAKEMRAIAREHGFVTVMLLLNYPFNSYVDQMTPAQIAAQESEVAQLFDEILAPLVSSGDVWHPSSGRYIRGPGIAVRATDKGLRQLFTDSRILQITASN